MVYIGFEHIDPQTNSITLDFLVFNPIQSSQKFNMLEIKLVWIGSIGLIGLDWILNIPDSFKDICVNFPSLESIKLTYYISYHNNKAKTQFGIIVGRVKNYFSKVKFVNFGKIK